MTVGKTFVGEMTVDEKYVVEVIVDEVKIFL
jgi:hypothetical protein